MRAIVFDTYTRPFLLIARSRLPALILALSAIAASTLKLPRPVWIVFGLLFGLAGAVLFSGLLVSVSKAVLIQDSGASPKETFGIAPTVLLLLILQLSLVGSRLFDPILLPIIASVGGSFPSSGGADAIDPFGPAQTWTRSPWPFPSFPSAVIGVTLGLTLFGTSVPAWIAGQGPGIHATVLRGCRQAMWLVPRLIAGPVPPVALLVHLTGDWSPPSGFDPLDQPTHIDWDPSLIWRAAAPLLLMWVMLQSGVILASAYARHESQARAPAS